VIYDQNGRLSAAKERFRVPYPPELKHNIMRRSWKLLHSALPAYESQLVKAVKRQDLVSVNHRTAAFLEAYFDFLFAFNEQTHPGEKRLVQLCREQCKILPARFEENLNQLFGDLFQAPDRVPADIHTILAELERIQ